MIDDTIRTLFVAGDLDGILYQIEILMEDRARVRAENDAHKHTIHRLSVAFANITEPKTGLPIKSPSPSPNPSPKPTTPVRTTGAKPGAKPQPKPPVRTMNPPKPKPSKEALDLDLDLDL
jgi:cell division septation protein DedD